MVHQRKVMNDSWPFPVLRCLINCITVMKRKRNRLLEICSQGRIYVRLHIAGEIFLLLE